MRVHNAEKPCRKLHTLECSLRVAKNPYVLYAQPDNSVGRVWHGDEVRTTCVVTDGEMVTDEAGLSSTPLVPGREGTGRRERGLRGLAPRRPYAQLHRGPRLLRGGQART